MDTEKLQGVAAVALGAGTQRGATGPTRRD
jgi:hypothetical protein